jgi:hypothetical protein
VRNPAGDRAAVVGLILLAESGAQPRLLIADDKEMECDRKPAGYSRRPTDRNSHASPQTTSIAAM